MSNLKFQVLQTHSRRGEKRWLKDTPRHSGMTEGRVESDIFVKDDIMEGLA